MEGLENPDKNSSRTFSRNMGNISGMINHMKVHVRRSEIVILEGENE
jgi:hypothetical protein